VRRYLAPELLKASNYAYLDKADIFALGITLYELASGSPLPTGGSVYTKLRMGQLALLTGTSLQFQAFLKVGCPYTWHYRRLLSSRTSDGD
jgi:wee1-like protein kinase